MDRKNVVSSAISRSYIIGLKGLHKKYNQVENLPHLFQLECHLLLFLLCQFHTFNGVGDYLLWVVTRQIIRVVCTAKLIEMELLEPTIQQNGFRSILMEHSNFIFMNLLFFYKHCFNFHIKMFCPRFFIMYILEHS